MNGTTKHTTRTITIDGRRVHDALHAIKLAHERIADEIGVLLTELERGKTEGAPAITRLLDDAPAPSSRAEVPARAAPSRGDGELGAGAFAVLEAIEWWDGAATDETIAIVTGYKETSRRTYVSELVGRGFVEREGKRLRATTAGQLALGPPMQRRRKPSPADLLETRLGDLGEGAQTVLNAIVGAGTIDQAELLELTGYKETSVRTYVSDLVSRHLVVRPDRGIVRLHPELGGPR